MIPVQSIAFQHRSNAITSKRKKRTQKKTDRPNGPSPLLKTKKKRLCLDGGEARRALFWTQCESTSALVLQQQKALSASVLDSLATNAFVALNSLPLLSPLSGPVLKTLTHTPHSLSLFNNNKHPGFEWCSQPLTTFRSFPSSRRIANQRAVYVS